jgi:hypothetical protein
MVGGRKWHDCEFRRGDVKGREVLGGPGPGQAVEMGTRDLGCLGLGAIADGNDQITVCADLT